MEPVSFRLNKDFEVKLGKDQKTFIIPRMLFSSGKDVLTIISRNMGKRTSEAISVVASMLALDKSAVPETFNKAERLIEAAVDLIFVTNNYNQIVDLLKAISNGFITEEMMKETEVSYEEAVGLSAYLVNENFASLKNLSASLQATYMLARSDSE